MSKASKRRRNEAYKASHAPEHRDPPRVDDVDPVPADLDPVFLVFPANVRHLMPDYDKLPAAFRQHDDPWCSVVSTWFFKGLDAKRLHAKPHVDHDKALRHCAAIMRSFEPKHEHKTACVAYLLSKWFEPYAALDEQSEETKT